MAAVTLYSVVSICLLSQLGFVLSASTLMHHHMSIDDLRRVFQVDSHDEVPEYEVVHIHSLSKRSLRRDDDGDGMEAETDPPPSSTSDNSSLRLLRLRAFGRDVHLKLQRADGLFKGGSLRMWSADPNITEPENVEFHEIPHEGEDIGDLYQDEENVAALLLHRDAENGGLLVEGTIGHDLVVKPVPANVRQHLDKSHNRHEDEDDDNDDEMFLDEEGEDIEADVAIKSGFPLHQTLTNSSKVKPQHHIVYRRSSPQKEEQAFSDYAFMEPDHLAKRFRNKRAIRKREAPYVIYPEILVIVDYDGYRLHGGDNVQIKRYFVSFWNGVDLRYKLLKGPKIRISIAGIIISRGRDATPYLERNRVGRDAIDSAAALTDMGKYLFRERRLPVYDIAVAVTKYDMCRRRKGGRCTKGTAGFAYVGGACVVNKRLEKVNSVAIIEDTGGFSGIIVGAHEVGHLLGAVHDGSPPPSYLGGPGAEKCRWEDGYIMSDLRHTEKGFRWSPCSISSFHHFLNGDTATCLYNSPHEDESLPRVLPGKLLTLDAQCRKDRGTSACFKDDRVCAQLFCFDAGSGYCVAYRPAAEGSPCGDGQYCINGRCVAEHENIIPDYSQNTPAYIRRNDADSAATQTRPVYANPPNSTSQRSTSGDFWSAGGTTTPIPQNTPSKHLNNFNSFYNKGNSFYTTAATTTTTNNPYVLNQYHTESTILQPIHIFTPKIPFNFQQYYSFTTTKNPYDFSNKGLPTTSKSPLNGYNQQLSSNNPYYLNHQHSTTNKPFNFGYSLSPSASKNYPSFDNNNNNNHYFNTTTKYPLFYTASTPDNTTLAPYSKYSSYTSPTSTTIRKVQTYFFSSATQNEPTITNNTHIVASVHSVEDTDKCEDKVSNISGSMSCRVFLERYGYQYCTYQYMQRNCCATQRAICTNKQQRRK